MLSSGYFSFLCKMLEKHLWNSFLLYLLVEFLQLVHEITSFPEMLYKRGILKNLSKLIDKHEKQPRGVLSKDVLKNFEKFTEKRLCWSLFLNKVAGWKLETVRSSCWRCSVKKVFLTLLKRDPRTGEFCEIFRKAFLQNTSSQPLLTCSFFFFLFCRSVRFAPKNQLIWWSNDKLGKGIHKPIQFCVIMEIRWKFHCQVVVAQVPT